LAQDLELAEKSKWNTIFRLDIPVGNFGLPLETFHLFGNSPVEQANIALPFTVQLKFPFFSFLFIYLFFYLLIYLVI